MLCLSGFELYSRWVPLKPTRTALGSPFAQLFHHEFQSSFPFLVHRAVPIFSNTRFNNTMVMLKWVLSRFYAT